MGLFRAASRFWILGQSLLLVGVLPLGCDRNVATQVESAPEKQAMQVNVAPSPITPANDGLDEFKQALAQKFDRSRWRERPATPQGGILHMPNGQAVHAAIVVKNPDGTVSTECVSSSAEVSALVDEIRGRRAP